MNTADVNRGYLKIEGAASAFNFDFRDKTVLDIGSSTGGFTQYALDHGAKKVIAVEKGSRQMKAPLCFDPKVELHEKTDIFDVKTKEITSEGHPQSLRGRSEEPRKDGRDERPEDAISFVPTPDVIIADVSFVSLTRVLKHAKEHLSDENTEFLVMLKPQFEAREDQLVKGIVKNEKIRRDLIKNFEHWLKQNNFVILNKRDNTLQGRHGNTERFYYLKLAI